MDCFSKRALFRRGLVLGLALLGACGGTDSAASEVEQIEPTRWDDPTAAGYVMTYTQTCGSNFVAEEPVSVWVEGGGLAVVLDQTSIDAATIPDLLGLVDALSDGFEVISSLEGEFGQPTEIIIDRTGDQRRVFCFELIDFGIASRDGTGRQEVPSTGPAVAPSRDESSFNVGVASCNGDPTVSINETATEIRVEFEAERPEGGAGDECLDETTVTLAEPIGDREIVDGFGGRVLELQVG